MADGKGCKCAAYDESECACDADWTPQELIDARAEIARLRLTDAERESIERQANYMARTAQGAGDIYSADLRSQEAATLRGLLERTK